MLETLQELAVLLLLAIVFAILAYLIKGSKQKVLEIITSLVQKAEQAIQGSGLGAEKKAKVLAQLEAMGIKVTQKVMDLVDQVVLLLNTKSGWMIDEAKDKLVNKEENTDVIQK